MTRVTSHSTRARKARRAADGDLLLNVLVKLVDASDVSIETVYLVSEFIEFFNDFFVVVLGSLGQKCKS